MKRFWRTVAPYDCAISTVLSVEKESTTKISFANAFTCRKARPRWILSLWVRMMTAISVITPQLAQSQAHRFWFELDTLLEIGALAALVGKTFGKSFEKHLCSLINIET